MSGMINDDYDPKTGEKASNFQNFHICEYVIIRIILSLAYSNTSKMVFDFLSTRVFPSTIYQTSQP